MSIFSSTKDVPISTRSVRHAPPDSIPITNRFPTRKEIPSTTPSGTLSIAPSHGDPSITLYTVQQAINKIIHYSIVMSCTSKHTCTNCLRPNVEPYHYCFRRTFYQLTISSSTPHLERDVLHPYYIRRNETDFPTR